MSQHKDAGVPRNKMAELAWQRIKFAITGAGDKWVCIINFRGTR